MSAVAALADSVVAAAVALAFPFFGIWLVGFETIPNDKKCCPQLGVQNIGEFIIFMSMTGKVFL